MRSLNESNVTEAVMATFQSCDNPRLKEIMTSLTTHLHDFVREVEPTEKEWLQAIEFLTETGKMCDEARNEFILLSDTLGASILVDAINHRKNDSATETTVLGPFYREGAPEYANGADMRGDTSNGLQGESVVVRGRVMDAKGEPLANALLDVWETAPDGLYHMQKNDSAPEFELCGKVYTDADGYYQLCMYKPVPYAIPSDGPVGQMLRSLGRGFYRPAHIHMIVSAENHDTVVTQIFTDDDDYIDSDAVFGVKDSLVVSYSATEGGELAQQYQLEGQYWTVDYDFILERSKQ